FFPCSSTPWRLDVSPGYFVAEDAPRLIKAALSDSRVILIMRDPVDRAFSAWKMQITKGSELESFETAIYKYPHYLQHGRYGNCAQRFVDQFGRENVLFLFFEDLQ